MDAGSQAQQSSADRETDHREARPDLQAGARSGAATTRGMAIPNGQSYLGVPRSLTRISRGADKELLRIAVVIMNNRRNLAERRLQRRRECLGTRAALTV